jgi:tetratricopeptide (TPR) repeat protein
MLGQALLRRGEFRDADEVMRAAVATARTNGDRSTEIRAQLLLDDIASRTDPTWSTERALERALELRAELEGTDDLGTLAYVYETVGARRFLLGHAADGEADLERTVDLARRAGDLDEELRALNSLLRPKLWGPTPAREVVEFCERILARDDINVSLRLHALWIRAVAAALLGDEESAREAAQRALVGLEEYDLRLQRGLAAVDVGFAFRHLGDLDSAEAELRRGYDVFNPLGERGVLSTLCGELATVLALAARFDEAEAFANEARPISAPDDFDAQSRWRTALARVRRGGGDLEAAERLAREAASITGATDFILLEADAQQVLGETLAAQGRGDASAEALTRALRLYEQKQALVRVTEVRASLSRAPRLA